MQAVSEQVWDYWATKPDKYYLELLQGLNTLHKIAKPIE